MTSGVYCLSLHAGFTLLVVRHQNKDGHIRFVNAALKRLAAEKGATYVDLYTRFLGEPGKMDKRYTNDGLHLTGEGFLLWKRILQENGYMN